MLGSLLLGRRFHFRDGFIGKRLSVLDADPAQKVDPAVLFGYCLELQPTLLVHLVDPLHDLALRKRVILVTIQPLLSNLLIETDNPAPSLVLWTILVNTDRLKQVGQLLPMLGNLSLQAAPSGSIQYLVFLTGIPLNDRVQSGDLCQLLRRRPKLLLDEVIDGELLAIAKLAFLNIRLAR